MHVLILIAAVSEPLKAKTQRPRVHRMSPITKRYDSGLGKTLSVGAGLGRSQ